MKNGNAFPLTAPLASSQDAGRVGPGAAALGIGGELVSLSALKSTKKLRGQPASIRQSCVSRREGFSAARSAVRS